MSENLDATVECPHCGNRTAMAAKCTFCGKSLRKEKAMDLTLSQSSANTHAARARSFERLRGQLTLADVQFHRYMADGSLPGLKRLRVPNGFRAVVQSQIRGEEVGPGEHLIGTLGVASSLRDAVRSNREGGALCVCTFPTGVVSAPIALPDLRDIEDADSDVDAAIKSLSLRTADNLMGLVEMTVRMRVADPLKLTALFAHKLLQEAKSEAEGPRGVASQLAFPFQAVYRYLFGGKPEQVASDPIRYSLNHIYRMFRNELSLAVRAAVRQETAQSLYDTVTVRDRVTEDLSRTLSLTLDSFGLGLDRITTFKFQCEEYDDLLRERAGLALRREAMSDSRTAAELETEEKQILRDVRRTQADDHRDATTVQSEMDRHRSEEEGKTQEVRSRLAAEELHRKLAADAMSRAHSREQTRADEVTRLDMEKQKLELEHKRMEMQLAKVRGLMEIQVDYQNAQIDNQRRLLEAADGKSSEEILIVAMTQNPALAGAFQAMQQAKMAALGNQRQIEMHETFRKQIEQAYGQNNELSNGLLREAVKQWGHVAGKTKEAERAQVLPMAGGAQLVQVVRPDAAQGSEEQR